MVDLDPYIKHLVAHYFDWAQANPVGMPHRPLYDHRAAPTMNLRDFFGVGMTLQIRTGLDYDGIATAPGGLQLFVQGSPPSWPEVGLVNLDFAHDVNDEGVRALREVVLSALAERNLEFLPVSFQAWAAASNGFRSVDLVAREGLQCVLHINGAPYISGFDNNEDPPLYFLARLPHEVSTYAQALESLKPRSVKVAEAQGRTVLRQGDMFAIPTDYTSEDLLTLGAVFSTEVARRVPRNPWARLRVWGGTEFVLVDPRTGAMVLQSQAPEEPPDEEEPMITRRRGLYGTAHTATELAYLPDDGTMFARGIITHDPTGVLNEPRLPDHHPLQLPGRQWFLMARNAVPTTSQERR